ncbi:nitrous oxide reductase family maturation protein NosD [Mesonia sp. MT50]|uniref:Nitrous oxide reductase family maturation protein NosD n=1 Tax=Mesonia profundi TaxID=3070998 RepID=A0ABU1A3R5_9FLAO|nr:nitrous oxide reductase family maturation protein NosD [Mesonia profundi]MDQ7918349.1 nitrous oxide reductase family maturation protein NosD [Mesonia profundi]
MIFRLPTLFFLISFFYYGFNSANAQITVCDSCEFTSVKAGIKAAKPGDTVLIKAGLYKENSIIIDKPITLLGENLPTIDGEDKGDIIQVFADDVTIDGLKLINVGSSYTEDYAAIRVSRAKNFVIQNLELRKIFFGIYLEKAREGIVRNNNILGDAVSEHNSGNGIQLWYSKKIEITNNSIQKVRDGIYLEFADDCRITKNLSKDNLRYGLHFMFSNDDVYNDNVFENNGAGVAVMFSKRIHMKRNKFQYNWGTAAYGLLLKEINDAEIANNIFEENTTGINVEGSNRVNYTGNTFKNNGWAIKVKGACYNNEFINNNFLYNSFDVSYNARLNDNKFHQNFWSEYTGYDLDEDGFGDVPYRPVKLFSYIVNRTPETIILMRSLFVDIIDFSEKVSPVFTPDNLLDEAPLMKKYSW